MQFSDDPLFDEARNVKSRQDFALFIANLSVDYERNRLRWENDDLQRYLNGLSLFANDMGGYFKNMGDNVDIEHITWSIAAQMILAATVYDS